MPGTRERSGQKADTWWSDVRYVWDCIYKLSILFTNQPIGLL